jgi:hypothetical protein
MLKAVSIPVPAVGADVEPDRPSLPEAETIRVVMDNLISLVMDDLKTPAAKSLTNC